MVDHRDLGMRGLDLSPTDKQGKAMYKVMRWLEDESKKRVLLLLSKEEIVKQFASL